MSGDGSGRWQIWVDTGGTFTDAVAVSPAGRTSRAKVLSSSALRGRLAAVSRRSVSVLGLPGGVANDFFAGWRLAALEGEPSGEGSAQVASSCGGELELLGEAAAGLVEGARIELRSPEEAPIVAARLLTSTAAGSPLPPVALRLATTRGTNALLERRGAATALFVTRGFGDLLTIGDQRRPELFALAIDKPAPLYSQVYEVDERLAADGSVLRPLDAAALGEVAREALVAGCEAAAVAFLHSYLDPGPERQAERILRAAGFRYVALSAELAPLIKILPRAQTAVVDAYLSSVLEGYLDRVAAALGDDSSLHVMTSAGGLVGRGSYRAKDSLLSGPAGGVVGAGRAGELSGLGPVIAFDMGGTSTDVARHAGEPEYVFEQRVGDAVLASPGLAIETVAAGGGSVCGFDGAAFTVGPQSAGADPGPASYGAGGPLTLTDVNLLLGRIDPDRFGIPLVPRAAQEALGELRVRAERDAGEGLDEETVLAGLLRIADERMAEAIRRISVRRGFAPGDHSLVAFGGAGAQHACAVAEVLAVDTVLVPPDAGLLSALGLGAAVIERFAQRQVLAPLAQTAGEIGGWVEEMGRDARGQVAAEVGSALAAEYEIGVRRCLAELRWNGQESALEVELPSSGAASDALAASLDQIFRSRYRERYGYLPEGREVELVSLRLVASSSDRMLAVEDESPARGRADRTHRPVGDRPAWFPGGWRRAPVFDRQALAVGMELAGPALVFEPHSATVVPPRWQLTVDEARALVLRRRAGDE